MIVLSPVTSIGIIYGRASAEEVVKGAVAGCECPPPRACRALYAYLVIVWALTTIDDDTLFADERSRH
jgi:hypothetical protein